MQSLEIILPSKIKGSSEHVQRIIYIILRSIASDVEWYVVKGLETVEEIILAQPFTRYGWLLAIYQATGKTEDSRIIVYYNSVDPRWTASFIVHETIHKALNIRRDTLADIIIDETLAYLASFKSGFLGLYEKGIRESVELLSQCITPPGESDQLLHVVVPRILAKRLNDYDYDYVVKKSLNNLYRLVKLWLNTNPSLRERTALSTGFTLLGINPVDYGLEKTCKEVKTIESEGITSREPVLEGVDKDFTEMTRILKKVARNPSRARDILAPWWNEIEPILNELEAYIILYSSSS
ncbi:hypothetical protein J4526_07620 [Desulfurococcaceae archaeon MEX13E-LK6-19]|nr:hypothetical protein J4526_07620 [Desulfurococcaceae archaeon MEX13E-LK6-19]